MTHIWVPRAKIIEPRRELRVTNGLCGRFKLEAERPDGQRRLLADWFPNLITNAGLNRIGANADWLSTCAVGTGSTTPSVADTTLVNEIAITQTAQASSRGAQSEPPYYASWTRTYRFAQGAAAGNLTEVGIGWSGSPLNLFSRALILDDEGNPTTITVLEDEFLDVSYEFRIYPPESDVMGQVNIRGVDRDTVRRAAQVTNPTAWAPRDVADGNEGGISPHPGNNNKTARAYNGALGDVTGVPSGAFSDRSAVDLDDYTVDTFYREALVTWGLDSGNLSGGISAIKFGLGGQSNASAGLGVMQISFDPPIAKTDQEILALVLRHTWGRKTLSEQS